jgi:hypothetical protein
MWMLRNTTPYAAERTWVRDRAGEHHWVVAVRASFDLSSAGSVALAEEQPPPALAPVHFGEPGHSSLRMDSDLVLEKPGTDVIVNASAYAPRGKAAEAVPVSLRVGTLQKVLVVHGERVYVSARDPLAVSACKPFVTRPIRYEFAFGGRDLSSADPQQHVLDAQNPVGRGVVAAHRKLSGLLAHAIEYPTGKVHQRGPAGFGAIDGWWQPRRAYAGTYDARWERDKKPFLPDDYDARFTLAAPRDQQLSPALRGGEPIELVNLTPEGRLTFTLPARQLRFETRFGRRRCEHAAGLASVILETEERKLSMVWQTQLPVKARDCDYLDETLIREEAV